MAYYDYRSLNDLDSYLGPTHELINKGKMVNYCHISVDPLALRNESTVDQDADYLMRYVVPTLLPQLGEAFGSRNNLPMNVINSAKYLLTQYSVAIVTLLADPLRRKNKNIGIDWNKEKICLMIHPKVYKDKTTFLLVSPTLDRCGMMIAGVYTRPVKGLLAKCAQKELVPPSSTVHMEASFTLENFTKDECLQQMVIMALEGNTIESQEDYGYNIVLN